MTIISLEDGQRIIDAFHPSHTVSHVVELPNSGYIHIQSYIIDLVPSQCCILLISTPQPPSPASPYHPNTLSTSSHLFSLVHASTTGVPTPPLTLDTSLSILPFHLLLSPPYPFPSTRLLSLPRARAAGVLSEQDSVVIDLRLGQFFGQLHSRVQNDWFGIPLPVSLSSSSSSGLPSPAPDDTAYSWQETFTSLLEDRLAIVHSNPSGYHLPNLPFEDLRRYLSRAIGSFLFDDVDVPALVWFTGSEEDIYVLGPLTPSLNTLPTPDPDPSGTAMAPPPAAGTIAFVLPSFAHALWGDPLLDSIMLSSPSAAFMEGYRDGGGPPLLVFPRQRTKRIWYTVFLALVVLTTYGPESGEGKEEWMREKRAWARETLMSCVEKLKDAPCY